MKTKRTEKFAGLVTVFGFRGEWLKKKKPQDVMW